jgi:hypothetical protein
MIALFAWTTRLPDGTTSLVGAIIDDLHTPLIATRLDVAAGLRPLAKSHAEATGQPVFFERFEYRETLDTIDGGNS